ncbi:LiaF transmembrane domain-containing protein [Chitinophaga sp. 30R24]|uniref:LiaF transmembrane domain-containing protein n=1 Tax=Chitinophaga sp. 30R24 TaxID=3248838 RepID=UPI003B8F1E65
MKNEDIDISKRKKKGQRTGGTILIIIGVFLLLQRLDLDIPHWMYSWQMLPIGIGVALGARNNFKAGGWMIPVLIGSIFLVADVFRWSYDTSRFIWPVVMIIVGLMIILKKNYAGEGWNDYKKNEFLADIESSDAEDSINATAIFGSVNKVVMSKNFKGGEVTAIFGGTVLNFMKADIQKTAVLDVSAIMGGCEIIVPSNWKVQVDVTCILGGVEDKRYMELLTTTATEKLLILKGSCILGGVEIKSYA